MLIIQGHQSETNSRRICMKLVSKYAPKHVDSKSVSESEVMYNSGSTRASFLPTSALHGNLLYIFLVQRATSTPQVRLQSATNLCQNRCRRRRMRPNFIFCFRKCTFFNLQSTWVKKLHILHEFIQRAVGGILVCNTIRLFVHREFDMKFMILKIQEHLSLFVLNVTPLAH